MYYAGAILILGLWLVAVDAMGFSNPLLLPGLIDVLKRLGELSAEGRVWIDFAATMQRWCIGYTLGALGGVALGMTRGLWKPLHDSTELPIEFFRTLPVTAIFPLFLIFFGIGDESKIAMAFLPTFLLMTVNATYGVLYAAPERIRMARAFGASKRQVFWRVILPDALPQIFIGLRLALSLSLIVTIVSEMFIGTDYGLGQRIYDSYLISSVTTLYAMLVVLGVTGFTLNKIFLIIESRFIFWAGR